jgi:glycosyltransferase involved in cell wall biosynthesis
MIVFLNYNEIRMNPTVSILTITQHKRAANLAILADLIAEQTYPVLEWILVEGSPTEADAKANAEQIKTLVIPFVRIQYIAATAGLPLGSLRNRANTAAEGDIRVVMDDDDYYPPERVRHAVTRLLGSTALLAGCSAMRMYDYTSHQLVQFREIHGDHSVFSCMAWKRAYEGRCDESATKGEESGFTHDFTEPMVQLDPTLTIVQSSHGHNTVPKQRIVEKGMNRWLFEVQDPIESFIPRTYLDRISEAVLL